MATPTALARPEERQLAPMARIKNYMLSTEVKKRFSEMMGADGIYYLNQVLIVVANSEQLQRCTPESILISAMRAASLRLSVDPAQGQAWIIPYKGKATFQLGYRGIYELAMRTHLYRFIHVSEIYEGEEVSEDRFTGMHSIAGKRAGNKVIAYMLYFELVDGFKKTFVMTVDEIAKHAARYSQSYSDNRSKWHDPVERPKMEKKTVLSNGLRKWGRFNPDDLETIDQIEESQGWTVPDYTEVTPPEPTKWTQKDFEAIGCSPEDAKKTAERCTERDAEEHDLFIEEQGTIKKEASESAEAKTQPAKLSLESASSVLSHDGTRYGDIPTDKLGFMRASIQKKISQNNLDQQAKDDLKYKIDAIDTIVNSRKTQP